MPTSHDVMRKVIDKIDARITKASDASLNARVSQPWTRHAGTSKSKTCTTLPSRAMNTIAKADGKLKEMEQEVLTLAPFKFLEVSQDTQKLTGGRQTYTSAKTASAVEPVLSLVEECRKSVKKIKEDAKSCFEALEKYKKKRKEAADNLGR